MICVQCEDNSSPVNRNPHTPSQYHTDIPWYTVFVDIYGLKNKSNDVCVLIMCCCVPDDGGTATSRPDGAAAWRSSDLTEERFCFQMATSQRLSGVFIIIIFFVTMTSRWCHGDVTVARFYVSMQWVKRLSVPFLFWFHFYFVVVVVGPQNKRLPGSLKKQKDALPSLSRSLVLFRTRDTTSDLIRYQIWSDQILGHNQSDRPQSKRSWLWALDRDCE